MIKILKSTLTLYLLFCLCDILGISLWFILENGFQDYKEWYYTKTIPYIYAYYFIFGGFIGGLILVFVFHKVKKALQLNRTQGYKLAIDVSLVVNFLIASYFVLHEYFDLEMVRLMVIGTILAIALNYLDEKWMKKAH